VPQRALLAEDEVSNAMVAKAALELYGCVVDVVSDGGAAVHAATTSIYDIVFMDYHMPVMSGLEATAEIRRFEAEHARPNTPIVALTASAMPEERQACLDAGMDDILVKPFQFPELLRLLRRWTKTH
jgi:CheY-like chemotaxis protein